MTATIDSLPEEHGHWRFTKEQEAQFTAKLCFIAAQGEQQTNTEYEIGFEEDLNESDAVTDDGVMIVDSGLPSLKRKFLDRMAETFARKKLASFVSATAMEEYEDKIVVYVVRNEAMVKKDKRFRQTLKICLESISGKGRSDSIERASTLTISLRPVSRITEVNPLGTVTLLLQRSHTDSSV